MRTGSFLPTTVGAVGVIVLIVNLLTEGHVAVAHVALGLILFSITLAVVGLKAEPRVTFGTGSGFSASDGELQAVLRPDVRGQ